jgi:hypothetical protein
LKSRVRGSARKAKGNVEGALAVADFQKYLDNGGGVRDGDPVSSGRDDSRSKEEIATAGQLRVAVPTEDHFVSRL